MHVIITLVCCLVMEMAHFKTKSGIVPARLQLFSWSVILIMMPNWIWQWLATVAAMPGFFPTYIRDPYFFVCKLNIVLSSNDPIEFFSINAKALPCVGNLRPWIFFLPLIEIIKVWNRYYNLLFRYIYKPSQETKWID